MSEQNRSDEPDGQQFRLNLGLVKTLFDLSWKIIPALWVAFHWYSDQDAVLKTTKGIDSKLVEIQTEMNREDRERVVLQGEIDSLKVQFQMQREFEQQTMRPK